jgi:hypothetical protein
MHGISAFMKENPESYLSLLSSDDTSRRQLFYEIEHRPLLDMESDGVLILGFSASRSMRNK